MYLAHFGLREEPFALAPDPAFLYLSRQHHLAFSMLRYCADGRAEFSLLSGEVGSGKTLLIRHLLRSLNRDVTVGLLANTTRGMGRLLPWICGAFGIEHRGLDEPAMFDAFVGFLVDGFARRQRVVLIVDEAQNLGPEMLEELRVLSNVNAERNVVLQTFLVGQPEIRTLLQRPELRQFAQRIGVDFHLDALSRMECTEYVRHRLTVAGGDPEIIEVDAIECAYLAAGGVPRLVNQLCDMALVYAFADQLPVVGLAQMRQVVADKAAGGVFPLRSRAGVATADQAAAG